MIIHHLFAQQAESSPDWTNIAQYGVLGLVVLAFIFGKIVPGYIYERRVEEHEAEKAENRRLEETIKERVIPALVKSTDVMVQVLDMLNSLEQAPGGPTPRRRGP
jgi:hypothetical protein